MRAKYLKEWMQNLGHGLQRFPLGWAAAVLATIAVVFLNHRYDWKLSDSWEYHLVHVLQLWPVAIFGNVAWRLRAERDSRPSGWGTATLAILLCVGWFLLPDKPRDSFWFGYFAAVIASIIAAVVLPTRHSGDPAPWDSGWPIVQATLMAILSAMLVVGGIDAALFSLEKLFALRVKSDVFLDIFFAGFFLVAPITAFAWLPNPFGSAQPQPGWIKTAARILLIPLSLLYALILYAYIVKIAVSAHWPDGWVALPTLVYAAIGLTGYLIARTARDRSQERWAGLYCRIFPVVLLPTAIVLLMAMQVRVSAYGFTEWRAIGSLLGIWLLGFSLIYTVRPHISTWWLAATLGLLALVSVVGPVWISRHSQASRLEQRLETLGVWKRAEGEKTNVSPEDWDDMRSIVSYLVRRHGTDSLPKKVLQKWVR